MKQFQALLSKACKRQQDSSSAKQDEEPQPQSSIEDDGGDATQKAVSRIVRTMLGRSLTKQQRSVAGTIVYYASGAAAGGLYGSVVELSPRANQGLGLTFGTVLWLAANETAVPVLGLSGSPLRYPISSHLSALATHAVYGVTTELVRRTLRRMM